MNENIAKLVDNEPLIPEYVAEQYKKFVEKLTKK
jgi:hypothetical protein